MAKILLNIPDTLHKKAKKQYKRRGYTSVSEMYRDAIREMILEDECDERG